MDDEVSSRRSVSRSEVWVVLKQWRVGTKEEEGGIVGKVVRVT